MRKLWKDRNARWYLTGQSLSLFGDTSLWLALGIWVKELTGSAGAAGLTFFFFSLSAVISPFAGMIVDRVRRRRLLFWTNLASAALVLALFGVQGRGQVWLIYLVMFLYGVSYAFLGSAQSALLKIMLPEDSLADANGALQTVRQSLRLVSPLVGAGLFAVAGGHVIAVIDAATFVVAAGTLLRVRVEEPPPRRKADTATAGLEEEAEHWWAEVTAGVRHVWRTVVLRQTVAGTGVALLVIGFFESIAFAIVARGLHEPPTFLGVLLAVQGVGAIVGGPTAAPLMRRIGAGLMVGYGILIMAVGSLLEIPGSMPPIMVGMVLFGVALPWVIVGIYTLLQLMTPNDLQGRVFSAIDTVLSVPQTVSIGIGAVLVSIVDYRLLLAVIGAVLVMAAVYLLTRKEQRVRPAPALADGVDPEAGLPGDEPEAAGVA